ncbi:DUF2795 domain-containing protein [Thiohalocapsa sp. ML1]|jgi:hypothetical protein|uniref:DUF2795 domain-containing protein n=1 Tax=Thiohalocapsa sp. ML1 TaxID=1431688 RepID=UPI0007321414|nr:DUF2795 domain-containing protein [Thiohalocapsa sp. ML1]
MATPSAQGGHASAQTVSAAGIAQALGGIDFPAGKDDVLSYAESHDAPSDVLEALSNIPDREYESMADVEKGFGESH